MNCKEVFTRENWCKKAEFFMEIHSSNVTSDVKLILDNENIEEIRLVTWTLSGIGKTYGACRKKDIDCAWIGIE